MKKLPLLLAIVVSALAFMGCPYESAVPIDSPNVKVEQQHLGTWAHPTIETITYEVSQDGEFKYAVEEVSAGEEGADPTRTLYHGHISMVEGQAFLNLKGPDKDTYMLFKVDRDGSEVTLSDLSPHIPDTFSRSSDLQAFIAKHMHLSFFFGEVNTYKHK